MSGRLIKKELEGVLAWAKEKAHDESNPPWAWFQYMKLIEATETVLQSLGSTITTGSLQQSVQRQGNVYQLKASTSPQDNAQSHQPEERPLLPM